MAKTVKKTQKKKSIKKPVLKAKTIKSTKKLTKKPVFASGLEKLMKRVPSNKPATSISKLNKTHSKIAELEIMFKQIMSNKRVKTSEVKKHTNKIDDRKIINSQKIISTLNSLENKTKIIQKKVQATTSTLPKKEMQEINEIAGEIKKHRIVTDFDRVLFFVEKNKRVKISIISKELGIEKKRVELCAEILEKGNLIEIDYPLVGDIIFQIKSYVKPGKKAKKSSGVKK